MTDCSGGSPGHAADVRAGDDSENEDGAAHSGGAAAMQVAWPTEPSCRAACCARAACVLQAVPGWLTDDDAVPDQVRHGEARAGSGPASPPLPPPPLMSWWPWTGEAMHFVFCETVLQS
jgi:hypothetical protein